MERKKRLSDMQRIANAFHFTKKDLLLNREGKLSDAQRRRLWRRYWMALVLLGVVFGCGSVFLGVFLWGTAPAGTFAFLPSNAVVGDVTDGEQLFLFGIVIAVVFVLVIIAAIFGLIGFAALIRRSELHTYRGRIRVIEGFDDNDLKLIDDGRTFEIDDEQYAVLAPLVDQRSFAVYYLASRHGIVALEPI